MLLVSLWTEIQEKYALLSFHTTHTRARKSNLVSCLFNLFVEEWKGWDDSAVHAKRQDVGACSIDSAIWVGPLRTPKFRREAWNSSSADMGLNMYLPLVCPVCHVRSISEVMCFEFLLPKWLKCLLAEVVRQRWPPPDQCPRYSHNEENLDIKKYWGQYPDCSGTICPQHDLVPLTEPHVLFQAPSIWWLQMNWRDILNQSTPHIQ